MSSYATSRVRALGRARALPSAEGELLKREKGAQLSEEGTEEDEASEAGEEGEESVIIARKRYSDRNWMDKLLGQMSMKVAQ